MGKRWPKRSTEERNALLMGAQITLSKEECGGMGQNRNDAAEKDAQIILCKEEYAGSTGERSGNAEVRDAQILSSKEECALGMGQRSNFAAMKDAQNKFRGEESVGGMGQAALLTTHPLLLEQNSTSLLHLSVYPIEATIMHRMRNKVSVCLQKY